MKVKARSQQPVFLPSDFGFPPKFESFRPDQERIAIDMLTSDMRFSWLDAPTGAGKSIINIFLYKLLGVKRCLYVVGTKGLQHQVMAEFSEMGVVDVRGQSNYRCIALDGELRAYGRSGGTCDEGPCKVGIFCPMRKEGGCSYYDARDLAAGADIVVTNYAYWLTLGRHSEPDTLGEFDLLILDEAHSAPDWLADFCSVYLDEKEVKTLLGLRLPPIDEGMSVWVDWASTAIVIAQDRQRTIRGLLDLGKDRKSNTRALLRLGEIISGLSDIANAHTWRRRETPIKMVKMPGVQTDWVAERRPHGIMFSPVWAQAYAEQYLFRGIPRIVLSSATLMPAVGRYLGVPKRNADWHEITSGFDPSRRPIIYIPTTRVDRNMVEGQVRQWMNRIDRIIDGRLHWKGIIFTRSYNRAQLIYERSRHKDIMIVHTSKDTRDAVARFKHAKAPCILVSPAIEEGFDFPYDQCRYQIVSKIPFIDSRSPIIKERKRTDKDYPNYVAALSLVQECGRGMRAADDYCETFIIDDHWQWFRRAARFPKWFAQAWQERASIPAPGYDGA